MQASKVKPGQYFKLATDPRVLKRLAYDDGVYGVDADHNLVGVHPDSSAELVTDVQSADVLRFKITHHANERELAGRIEATAHGLEVFFDGYGTHDMQPGFGAPLFIEPDDNGHPLVYAWGEIDGQDFTHKVSLHGARDTREPT